MSDLNRWTGIGRLGTDPELRATNSGTQVANMRIACGWKTKDNEGTEWVSVVAFGRTAEICGEYLRKGSQIYVEGRLQTRKWQDKDGNDRYTTEIVCERMQMLGSKRDNQQSAPYPPPETNPAQAPASAAYDDDIPFAARHWLEG